MRTRIGATALAALLALGACERKAEEAPAAPAAPAAPPVLVVEGYQHQPGLDLAGFYKPDREILIDNWRLSHLSIGAVDAFDRWVAGERPGDYAPITLVFGDVNSPATTNALGERIHADTRKVVPSAWRVGETEIAFVAADAELGRITFAGQLDAAALARAKTGAAGLEVLTERLTVADVVIDGVGFTWLGGD